MTQSRRGHDWHIRLSQCRHADCLTEGQLAERIGNGVTARHIRDVEAAWLEPSRALYDGAVDIWSVLGRRGSRPPARTPYQPPLDPAVVMDRASSAVAERILCRIGRRSSYHVALVHELVAAVEEGLVTLEHAQRFLPL